MDVDHSIQVTIPPGYYEMPLAGNGLLESTQPLIEEALPELREDIPKVIGTLSFLLSVTAAKNTVYCGIGIHASPGGTQLTSWLTISALRGEPRNPRRVVHDLAKDKLSEEVPWTVAPLELADRPVLFSEKVHSYPAPDLTHLPGSAASVPIYQAEVLVPSDDGSTIAVIEFSTGSADDGPRFQDMLLAMVTTLRFVRAEKRTMSSLDL
ncbi:hypothetical protein DFR70_11775 [Nocardia tenerifensis]|uniref:Uncharacterized protein n=1 Tax=Nocardia tenerifensis TaxID=228006 RepID=A0A318JRU3_9NOCA|nr:hypothetical protein [Nocardia tenerifensis]PXX57647.1 hypothetical protein DFR70_11775 [Nocardia tenerifensis]